MQRLAWLLAVGLILAFHLPASPCVAGATLASYEALGLTGCTIGPETVDGFSFSVVSVGGGATALSDTNIFVTPTFGPDYYGVLFSSTGFSVTGTGFVNYLIGFTWDSIPIHGMGDALDPGTVDILTDGCVGAAFTGSSCSGTAVSVDVNLGQLTNTVFFSPTGILGVANNISMNANGESAGFNSIENDAYVTPEPASVLISGLGIAILAAFYFCQRRISSSSLVRNKDGAPAGKRASASFSVSSALARSPLRW
jgi:hypothetical protein